MPSIIPGIASPTSTPNVTGTITPNSGQTNQPGHTYFSQANITNLFYAYSLTGFTNYGILWNDSTSNVSGVLSGYYLYDVLNAGTWVAHSNNGNAYALSIGSGNDRVVNNGDMFALSASGNGIAIEDYGPSAAILNSGRVAAQALSAGSSGVGDAIGMALYNGAHVTNAVGASILAEGVYARAILMGRGTLFSTQPEVLNHGLIAAQSLDASHPSVGIEMTHLPVEQARIVNDGTIRAEIAIKGGSDGYDPYNDNGLQITNLAGGTIQGAITLGSGTDVIVNSGTIIGNVSTGDDNDVFDTRGGSWTGAADLGWNDDLFLGSAGNDVVKGGRNDDTLYGYGGNDLLLGGTGNDVLDGGAGNDGLYGESGDDRIVTQEGDAAFGGDGDDVIRAIDLAFARIDGGAGNDTLELGVRGARLDLAAALATGRLTGIETVALGSDTQIMVRAGDAMTLGGAARTLTVSGSADDAVVLVGGWTQASDVTTAGQTLHRFTLGGETILVAGTATVTIGASAPAGFAGLSAISGGAAAPVAGSVVGGELTSAVQTGISVTINSRLVIDADETWSGTNATLVRGYYDAALINNGVLTDSVNVTGTATSLIAGNDYKMIVNAGTIRIVGSGTSTVSAIAPIDRDLLQNSGKIEAIADQGYATGATVRASELMGFTNSGSILAQSNTATAVALQVIQGAAIDLHGPLGTNAGQIIASGGTGTIGVQQYGTRFDNFGTITASNSTVSGAHDAVGMTLYNASYGPPTILYNHGTITGPTALQGTGGAVTIVNDNALSGDVVLNSGSDVFINAGSVAGTVTLGDGADVYYGVSGHHAGTVAGGDGNDVLLGGVGETLDGGAGNDVLVGSDGGTLTGGVGNDLFVFASAAGRAEITDFSSGNDRIDLRNLGAVTVALTVQGSHTLVTATGVGGTVVVDVAGTVAQSDVLTGTLPIGDPGGNVLVAALAGSTVRGLGGDDILVGFAGNDTLDGGSGNDLMVGGAGDDTYIIDTANDRVIEVAGGGFDTVVNQSGASIYLAENVEAMTGGSAVGNALDNIMTGSNGDDVLTGGLGADTLTGGPGNDIFRDTVLGLNGDTITDFGLGDRIVITDATASGFTYSLSGHTLAFAGGSLTLTNLVAGAHLVASAAPVSSGGVVLSWQTNVPVQDDVNGDGKSDIVWRNTGGAVTFWTGNGSTFPGSGAVVNVGTDWHIAGTGDFNGDGKADILWRNANGAVTDWLSTDTDFAANPAADRAVGLDWQILGTGDFNGDGKTDILWRNLSTGSLTDWLSNRTGFANGASVYALPDSQWHFAGTGDFNGDGKTDIVWRHAGGALTEWLSNGDGFSASPTTSFAGTDWQIAGTGDFNGDGRDDIVWRNTNGAIAEWTSTGDGAFQSVGTAANTVGTDWQIVGTGDYNGDGRADILWHNADGSLTDWFSTGTGFTANPAVLGGAGQDWSIA